MSSFWILTAARNTLGMALCAGLFHSSLPAQTGGLNAQFSKTGISSLRYGNDELTADGDMSVTAVSLRDAAGQITAGATQSTVTGDAAGGRVLRQYPWGTIQTEYAVSGSRLNLTTTVTNNSSSRIESIWLQPLVLKFPGSVSQYDGATPLLGHNVGSPTVVLMSYGSGTVAIVNEDTSRPLLAGTGGSSDRPSNRVFPLLVLTGKSAKLPERLPNIDRPIAPGGSDQFRLSLRFAPAGASSVSMAGDIYRQFAAQNPVQFGWSDRRPIGSLFLASAAAGLPTNPRGWFLDGSIDTSTDAGRADFQRRVLSWIDGSVEVLRDMNAQGAVVWDLEGEEYPHPVTYIGDPRLTGTLAPEMDAVADELFARLRNAGLRTGVCVRPQLFTAPAGEQAAIQRDTPDPAQVLIEKIDYAKRRWSASLFYIDSNGDPSLPIDASILNKVTAAHPDVLLIPEHENFRYFTFSAPYNELRGGYASTAEDVRVAYPGAFSIINVADGALDQRFREVASGVAAGDILLFRGWYEDPLNARAKDAYRLVPDAEAPVISVSGGGGGSPVSGVVTVTAAVSDNIGIDSVQFELAGSSPVTARTYPYTVTFNTGLLPDGPVTVHAVARDLAGNSQSAELPLEIRTVVNENCPWMGSGEFVGCLFPGENLQNRRAIQIVPELKFDWPSGAPEPGAPTSNYSAVYQGVFSFERGEFAFEVASADGVRLFVDDQLLLNAWDGVPDRKAVVPAKLTAGFHSVRLEYRHREGPAALQLGWTKTR